MVLIDYLKLFINNKIIFLYYYITIAIENFENFNKDQINQNFKKYFGIKES